MKSTADKSGANIPHWAAPFAAGWADIAGHSLPNKERAPSTLGHREQRDRVQLRPKNQQRRIQTIGFAATGAAAAIWLLAVVWLWPIIT